jgi:tRNA G18 (ribose-2'-O)-methylase SpoU
MIFRNAEALGVEQIFFTGNSITPPNRKITKISRSTVNMVKHFYAGETKNVITGLKEQNYKILALEITDNSRNIADYRFSPKNNYAIIIGSEKCGVDEESLQMADDCLQIEMFGSNTSINVVSALTIALYEITKQIK